MEKIGIYKQLLEPIEKNYQEQKNKKNINAQLSIALDMMEIYIRFSAIYVIAILRVEDSKKYEILLKKLTHLSDLGSYTKTLSNSLYQVDTTLLIKIKSYLEQHSLDVELDSPETIFKSKVEKKCQIKSFISHTKSIDDLSGYALKCRNTNAHGATLNEKNSDFNNTLFSNLEKVLEEMKSIFINMLSIDGTEFFLRDYQERGEYQEVVAYYKNREYNLSPLLIYKEEKLFFINSSNNSNSEFLNYECNEYHTLNIKENDWKKGSVQRSLKEFNKQLNHSNDAKYRALTEVFVGRDSELYEIERYILANYKINTLSIITGKPGIGKSSFITALQSRLHENKKDLLSFIFYAIKTQTGDDELKNFTDKVKAFLSKNGIHITKEQRKRHSDLDEFNLLLDAMLRYPKKTFLLIIDGLDEFSNVVAFLQNLQLSKIEKVNNIHLIFATRPYPNICATLINILKRPHNLTLHNKEQVLDRGYGLELEGLSKAETQEMIVKLLPRDIDINNPLQAEAINTIVDKSGSLPIYIHYICKEIKNQKLGTNEAFVERLEVLAQNLPPTMEEYFVETFKNVSPLARKMLIAIFFAPYGMSLSELYELFKNYDIDKIAFDNQYFSEIEMLLREVEDDYYVFYHLSIKDAIFDYYKSIGDIKTFDRDTYVQGLLNGDRNLEKFFEDSNYYEPLDYLFSVIYAVREDSDFNETLKKIVDVTLKNIEKTKLKRYINRVFFNIYYSYTLFSFVTYKTSAFSDSKADEYQIQNEIKRFLKTFDKYGDKENTETISYAYKLARLNRDYQKSMYYYEMYSMLT